MKSSTQDKKSARRSPASHTPPTRPRRASETRGTILAAAARVFSRSGLEGARTDVIAAEAGVNKAMLYYYFKSKDLLYSAVLEAHFQEFHRRAMEVLGRKAAAGKTVLQFVEMHFDFISSQRHYPRLFQYMMMADATRGMRLIRKYMLPVSRKLMEVVEAGQRAGEFRRLDSRHAVISMVALNVFYFSTAPVMRLVTRVDPYAAENLKHRKKEVLEFVRYGLFLQPEASAL